MKNSILLFIAALAVTTFVIFLTSCSKPEETTSSDSAPFSSIEPIDSSTWAVNPADHGMTAEEFIRAESLHFMKGMAGREGINNFYHFTSLAKAEDKWVVSPNNDVIYSMAIVDASKGFTLTLPDTGDRFITGQVVTEEHMSHQLVGGGVYKFTGEEFNGSHVAIGVRVGTDATADDVALIVDTLQSQMKVDSNSAGEVSPYDEAALLKVRTALMAEYNKLPNTFGQMTDDVKKVKDWEKFTYCTAGAWGLAEDKYAMYLPYNLKGAKKDVCYTATYPQPKVGEFWSITAYNNEKYLMSNDHNIVNTGNAVVNDDGTVTVHFGPASYKDRKDVKNFILTTEDNWGFLMRAYEPDVKAFEAYEIPEIKPVDSTEAAVVESVTPAEARSIAKDAYIFSYPLVMYYRTMYLQAIDKDSPSYSGGFGKWLHLGTSSPKDTDIVTPNNDSPYSYSWVDLRAEPWVLTMPKIEEERFYTSQWNDLWGFVLDNPGSVEDGNEGNSVLLASPTWKGKLPKGVKRVIKGDTDFLGTLTRTQLMEPSDLPNVQRIQKEYELQPLSAFLGKAAPPAAPTIEWQAWKEGVETTEEFWSYVNFLLPHTTPNPEDKPILDRMAKIGLVAGQAWNPAALDKEVRDAIAAGIKDALADVQKASAGEVDAGSFFRSRADLNKNYFARTMGVFMGIFGNVSKVSVYFSVGADKEGELFDGSKHGYEITFTADQIPPAKNFWSFTMYKLPQRWLVENLISRYSIGSPTPGLKTAEDGSITLYFSAKSPGKDKESNWLPAPEGPFWMVLRTYGPGETILDKTWEVPSVIRTK